MGVSTGYLMLASSKRYGFSNADGASTPNLDFLKSELAKATKKIETWQAKIPAYLKNKNSWDSLLQRLSQDYRDCNSKRCRDKVQEDERSARERVKYYQSKIDEAKKVIDATEKERQDYQSRIDQYQASVASSIAQGNTDAGSQEVAEIEVARSVAKLKAAKVTPYLIGGGVLAVVVIGIALIRRK